jgi:alkylation response protein AidB-like acyl-CoA dehydrogenase
VSRTAVVSGVVDVVTDEVEAFEREALAFLDANSTRKPVSSLSARWGDGDDSMSLLEVHHDRVSEATDLRRSRAWRAKVFDAGFGWLSGPREYGGAGRSPILDERYRMLESAYDVPSQNIFSSSTHLVGPSIEQYGSEDLKRRTLRAFHRGDLLACQLLSEPGHGSDLAGLTTKAVRDGDDWVVTGQKVWNSYAHLADVGQLLARTDPDVPKHAGLTMFLVDMASSGVEVRPLRMNTGEEHFNEVFLTEVRIPDGQRVGGVGEGWKAMQATLMSERRAVGGGVTNTANDPVQRLIQVARHLGLVDRAVVRDRIAAAHIAAEVLRLASLRLEHEAAAGRLSGPEGSMLKLMSSAQHRRVSCLGAELLGPSVLADTGEWGTYAWANYVVGAPMLRIAGGTDEIQRNILAERVLGLPR